MRRMVSPLTMAVQRQIFIMAGSSQCMEMVGINPAKTNDAFELLAFASSKVVLQFAVFVSRN